MRVIKFRGWNGKEIIKEVFNVKVNPESEHHGISIPKQCVFSWSMSSLQDVMQFTGLLDINGVEIYEGDIVNVDGSGICYVKISSYYGVVYVDSDGYERQHADCASEQDYPTIIGNIHETPELLK